jgi:hypothetical protein
MITRISSLKVSRFPSFAFGENRLRSTALNKPPPLVPLASLDLPNRGRRVAYGSHEVTLAGGFDRTRNSTA